MNFQVRTERGPKKILVTLVWIPLQPFSSVIVKLNWGQRISFPFLWNNPKLLKIPENSKVALGWIEREITP